MHLERVLCISFFFVFFFSIFFYLWPAELWYDHFVCLFFIIFFPFIFYFYSLFIYLFIYVYIFPIIVRLSIFCILFPLFWFVLLVRVRPTLHSDIPSPIWKTAYFLFLLCVPQTIDARECKFWLEAILNENNNNNYVYILKKEKIYIYIKT